MLVKTQKYTFEDFFKFYQRTQERGGFEFVDGNIWDKYAAQILNENLIDYILSDVFEPNQLPCFGMPTQNHDTIVALLQAILNNALLENGYIAYSQKTAIAKSETEPTFREPDLVVVHRKLQKRNKFHQVLNPTMLVEVLSESTKKIDLVDKLEEYQKIPSVEVYMLVWQEKPKVIVYSRKDEFVWEERIYEGLEKTVFISFFELAIPLVKIYEDIAFEPIAE